MKSGLKLVCSMIITMLFFAQSSFAQSTAGYDGEESIPHQLVEVKPMFQGADASEFANWVYDCLEYPESAIIDGLTGRVTVRFLIQKDGSVTDIKVLRGVNEALDNEVIRVVSMSPKWTPGKQDGRVVAVNYVLPVIFNQTINESRRYIDLGLSVKWAICNIGANSPEGYGHYFCWGGTATQSRYHEDDCSTYGKEFKDISGDPQYDAARAKWGGTWRIPTKAEFDELKEKCTWTWVNQNGRNGYKVTSKINGNSIFLPAAGSKYLYDTVYLNQYGYYWTSTPENQIPDWAFSFNFMGDSMGTEWNGRYGGHSIRPVMD